MTILEQNKLLFGALPLPSDYSFDIPSNAEEVFIPVGRFDKLNGLFFRLPSSKGLILFFRGHSGNLQDFLNDYPVLFSLGYDLLVTDYRGFGKSSGNMEGEAQLFADAGAVFDFALRNGYRPETIVLYGHSIGASIATQLASTRISQRLILESPFSSTQDLAWIGRMTPAYPLNIKTLASSIDIPVLILHGNEDYVITVDHSRRIYRRLRPDQRKLVVFEGGRHGDLSRLPEYKHHLDAFLNQHVPETSY